MSSVSSRRITVLAAVAIAMLASAAAACGGSASPAATATSLPTQAPAPTATPQPTATATTVPTPAPTPDPALAPYLAAIEAGDIGPFPAGPFFGYEIDPTCAPGASCPGRRHVWDFGANGRLTIPWGPGGGTPSQQQYTSTEELLIILDSDNDCDGSAATYSWSLEGDVLVLALVGKESCGERWQILVDAPASSFFNGPLRRPTATATTPTPDPAMAAFLAAIEAGDTGPFPTGTFVREEISEGLIRLTFSSEGMVNMNGVVQRRFTSTDDILVLVVGGEDPYCDSTPDTYEWSFDGSELVFKGVGAQTCPDDSRFLELIPWHRP